MAEQGDRAAEQGDRAAEQGDGVVAEQGDGVAFVVGEKFSSYDELKAKVSTYEKSRCRSDSRTLDAARERVPRKVESAKKDLVYYRINLSCVFGGKKYQSKGGGKRPHQGDCSTQIMISLMLLYSVCVCVCVRSGSGGWGDVEKAINGRLDRFSDACPGRTVHSTSRSHTCTSVYLSLCTTCKPTMTWRAQCTAAPHQRKAEGSKTAVFGQNNRYSTLPCRNG